MGEVRKRQAAREWSLSHRTVFSEDYDKRGTIQIADRVLGIVNFVEQMTLFHLLARNIGRHLLHDPGDQVHLTFAVDGLLNRRPVIDDPAVTQSYLVGSQNGADREFVWSNQYSLDSLEADIVTLARDRIVEVFWSFGVRPDIISAIQRRLIGQSEPLAFPYEK